MVPRTNITEKCRLCGAKGPLKESHIIPRFIGKWMKSTSPTPYLRYGADKEKRQQDLFTIRLLCDSCEIVFSNWETRFASDVFHPSTGGQSVFPYGQWLVSFAASLSWRALQFRKSMDILEQAEVDATLAKMESHLADFLLGNEKHVGEFTQHIYHVSGLAAPVYPGSPMLNRYLTRTVEIDFLRSEDLSEVMVYVKLPMFVFFSVAASKYRKWMESSRIKKRSILAPKTHELPQSIWDYIVGRADKTKEILDSLSPKSKQAMDKALWKAIEHDPKGVAESGAMQAMEMDVQSYGKAAFASDGEVHGRSS